MNANKNVLGFVALACACLIWAITPFIGFFNLSGRQLAIYLPLLIVLGEALFVAAVALLGKEYWLKIKDFISMKWRAFRERFKG